MIHTLVNGWQLTANLGYLHVPVEYRHESWLRSFHEEYGAQFCDWNTHITDEAFAEPGKKLHMLDSLYVQIFSQPEDTFVTSTAERLAVLDGCNAVYPSVQGLTLVHRSFEAKLRELGLGENQWFMSLDLLANLPADDSGAGRVPNMLLRKDGTSGFFLSRTTDQWAHIHHLVVFTEFEPVR